MKQSARLQWDHLLELSRDHAGLRHAMDYVAQVQNGGHEQWLCNCRNDTGVAVSALRVAGAKGAAALAELSSMNNSSRALDMMDSVLYDGLDEVTVQHLYNHYAVTSRRASSSSR